MPSRVSAALFIRVIRPLASKTTSPSGSATASSSANASATRCPRRDERTRSTACRPSKANMPASSTPAPSRTARSRFCACATSSGARSSPRNTYGSGPTVGSSCRPSPFILGWNVLKTTNAREPSISMIAHEGVSEGRNAAIVSAPSSLPPRVFSTSPTRAGLLCARMVPSGMVTAIKRTSGRSANSSTRYCNRMPVRERVPDRTPLSSAVTSATPFSARKRTIAV